MHMLHYLLLLCLQTMPFLMTNQCVTILENKCSGITKIHWQLSFKNTQDVPVKCEYQRATACSSMHTRMCMEEPCWE